MLQGQWHIVIHTYGRRDSTYHERAQFDDIPGKRCVPPTSLSEADSQFVGQRMGASGVTLDLDAEHADYITVIGIAS